MLTPTCLLCGNNDVQVNLSSKPEDEIYTRGFRIVTSEHVCNGTLSVVISVFNGARLVTTLPHTYRDYPSVHLIGSDRNGPAPFIISVSNENYIFSRRNVRLFCPGYVICQVIPLGDVLVLSGHLEDSSNTLLIGVQLSHVNDPIFNFEFQGLHHYLGQTGDELKFVTYTYSKHSTPIPYELAYSAIKIADIVKTNPFSW